MIDFEWNPQKAEINRRKHGISFDEAATVFEDTLSVTYPDLDYSEQEERYLIIGVSSQYQVLVISHTYRSEIIRIISARRATKREQRFYEHGN
jgi:hypothetical protein